MSGHGGFSIIGGGNDRPPAIDLPKVEEVKLERPKTDALKLADLEPPKANSRLEQTNRLVAILDALILKAAKTATGPVDAQALKTAMETGGLDKATRKDIAKAAEKADAAFKAIAGFSGRQIAAALAKDDKGVFDWDANNPAGEAIKKALDAQAALSEKLNEALNRLPDDAPAATQAALEEAMFQTDRRASEIETLACQFADMAEKAGTDPAIAARLDRTLKALIPEQSLKMHDSGKLAADFRAALTPLAKRIDAFADKTEFRLADTELAKIRLLIAEAKNALAKAAKAYDDKGTPLDASLLKALNGTIQTFEARLDRIRGVAALESMRNFVEKTFSPPDIPLLKPQLRPMLAKLFPHLCAAMDIQKQLKKAALDFIHDPSWNNRLMMHQQAQLLSERWKFVKAELKKIATGTIAEGVLLPHFAYEEHRNFARIFGKFPAGLKAEFASAMMSFCADNKEREQGMVKAMYSVIEGVTTQTDHLYQMQISLESQDQAKFMTNKTVEAAFVGKIAITTLVETRLNGLPDEDADPKLDGGNVENSRPLGSGSASTVYELTYRDGSTMVFKPEAFGRQGADVLQLSKGSYGGAQTVAGFNMAAQRTADAFGLDDVMAKSAVGAWNGQFGLFMEKVPGMTAKEFAEEGNQVKPGRLTLEQIKELPDEQYGKVIGQIMRKSNRLEWFDLLTGQGDRHHSNYMLGVDENRNVTLKAIDNDECFGTFMLGPGRFHLKGAHARHFETMLAEVKTKLYPGAAREAQEARIDSDPGVQRRNDRTLVVDTARIKAPELLYCLKCATGCHVIKAPEFIDRELYDKLMAMKSGEARTQYIKDLKARLDATQVEFAVSRLDEAIRLAEKLAAKGRVIATDDWNKQAVQRQVAGPAPKTLEQVGGQNPLGPDNKVAKKVAKFTADTSVSIFRRDLLPGIAKPGWFGEQG